MIARAALCLSLAVVSVSLAISMEVGAQQSPERPFRRLDDGSFVLRTADSSTISMGPLPQTLASREPLFIIRTLEMLRVSGYPATLRESGVGGTAMVGLRIHASGQILETRIDATSGIESLDQAALSVVYAMAFDQVVAGAPLTSEWVSVPIRFQAR